jgi:hypothetical protein
MSSPLVVIVHGNQQPNAEATVIWDNAFAIHHRVRFSRLMEHALARAITFAPPATLPACSVPSVSFLPLSDIGAPFSPLLSFLSSPILPHTLFDGL